MEIIGVVRDVKYTGMDSGDAPVFYRLASQSPSRPMWLLIRGKGGVSAQSLVQSVKQEIRNQDPSVPADRISTLADVLSQSVELPRFRSLLMTALAATALLLAAIGIYGVMAYFVAQRRQEIGVRTALGATRSDVVRLVLGQGSRLSFIGIAAGLIGAFLLARFIEEMLFHVTAYDTVAFVAAALILGLVAILSSVIPALRASRIDPVTALRQE